MPRLLAIFIAVTALSATVYAGNPRARKHQLKQWISVEDVQAEIDFGREVAARIIARYSLYDNKELTKYLNLVLKSLAQYSNRPELTFTVGIIDTDIINAFAAPGGVILVTKGAISAMRDEAELAGVLAHEMMHISQKHIEKELNIKGSEGSAVSGLGRLVGGAGDAVKVAFVTAVDQAEKILFETGYKRRDEIEADSMGAVLLASLNYDPNALIRYFDRVKRIPTKETGQIKKLHPPFDERIDWIKKAIETEGLTGGKYENRKGRFDAHKVTMG